MVKIVKAQVSDLTDRSQLIEIQSKYSIDAQKLQISITNNHTNNIKK